MGTFKWRIEAGRFAENEPYNWMVNIARGEQEDNDFSWFDGFVLKRIGNVKPHAGNMLVFHLYVEGEGYDGTAVEDMIFVGERYAA